MKKQEVSNLIKEAIENKLFEHKFKQEISEIYDSRQDLQSAMLVSMMEELSGREIPDPTVLDEGVWEKVEIQGCNGLTRQRMVSTYIQNRRVFGGQPDLYRSAGKAFCAIPTHIKGRQQALVHRWNVKSFQIVV